MEYITVTEENVDREHIFCAISGNGDVRVTSQNAWPKARFAQGIHSPCTAYAIFHDGKFLGNEQQSVPKFLKQAGVVI